MAGTALAAKLGVRPEVRTLVVGPAPEPVIAQLYQPARRAGAAPYDVIIAFCPDRRLLERSALRYADRITVNGALWLLWIKRSSGVATDIGEADVRAIGLETGLVDNKIVAIDEMWSGLRFVRRLADR